MLTFNLKKQPLNLNYYQIIVFLFLTIISTGCQKQLLNKTESPTVAVNSSKSNNETIASQISFSTTALIAYCHGENITFSGVIENLVTTITDEQGVVHYTRHFRAKGLTGVGSVTGTVYDVIGGAEMFSVKDAVLNANGTLNLSGSLSASDLVIHEGTLVFVSRTDGTIVIARHIIHKLPNVGITENHWVCANG